MRARRRPSHEQTDKVIEAIQVVLDEEAQKRNIPRRGRQGEDLRTARPSLLDPEKRNELVAEVRRILGNS